MEFHAFVFDMFVSGLLLRMVIKIMLSPRVKLTFKKMLKIRRVL